MLPHHEDPRPPSGRAPVLGIWAFLFVVLLLVELAAGVLHPGVSFRYILLPGIIAALATWGTCELFPKVARPEEWDAFK
jgi:hypothetical protein